MSDKNAQLEIAYYDAEDLKQWWPGICPECGWRGLSRDAAGGQQFGDTGDYAEVTCPACEERGEHEWYPPELEDDLKFETIPVEAPSV